MAIRTLADGEPDAESAGKVLTFTTEDFVTYIEQGLTEPTEEYLALTARWDLGDGVEEAKGLTGLPEGAHLCNGIEIILSIAVQHN